MRVPKGLCLMRTSVFHPHTTWSTTTPANALKMLREAGVDNVNTIGCLRTYATRHGNGPFPFEENFRSYQTSHTTEATTQGVFRTGKHDRLIIDWAINMTGVDSLSVSHYDIFNGIVTNYGIVDDLDKPIIVKAYGPRH